MRRLPETCAIWLLTVLFASILITNSTQALPMFARKYGISCSSCHTTAPRLNETGYRFRAAGFRMPYEIGRDSEEPFDIYNYLSARIQVRTDVTRSRSGSLTSTKHQTLVQALEIYPFTGAWGKYFSSNIKLTFSPVASPAVAVENLYAKVNTGNERRFFGGRVGIFHPYDGYGAADNPATISRPFFQTNPANLNQSTFFQTWGFDQAGGEIGFDYRRTSIRAALLNGIVVSKEGDKFTAIAAQGVGLTKPSAGPTHRAPDFQLFVNHALHSEDGALSFHYYHGNLALPVTGTPSFFRNSFDRAAVYASYPVMKRLHLFTGYQRGRDHTASGATFSSVGAFGEASVPIQGMTAAGVRYDWFDPARQKAKNDLAGVTVYVNAWFFDQLRIVAEYQHKRTKRESEPVQEDDAFQIRIIYIK